MRLAPREPGEILAPGFVVLAHLHRGELLDIYDLWSEERSCRCVGKTLRPDARQSGAARRGLLREGRLLLRLTHPHIVRAYSLLTDPEPVAVLETLPGETLERFVERGGPLAAAQVAQLGLHCCSALAYLHRQPILHLDLTPANIVASQGLAKILDLSLARRPGPSRGGHGTPGFRAPEQERGGMLSAAADVFGLGAVLAFAVWGEPPLDSARGQQSASERVAADAAAPAPLRALIAACLDPEPARRPSLAAAAAVLAELIPQASDETTPSGG